MRGVELFFLLAFVSEVGEGLPSIKSCLQRSICSCYAQTAMCAEKPTSTQLFNQTFPPTGAHILPTIRTLSITAKVCHHLNVSQLLQSLPHLEDLLLVRSAEEAQSCCPNLPSNIRRIGEFCKTSEGSIEGKPVESLSSIPTSTPKLTPTQLLATSPPSTPQRTKEGSSANSRTPTNFFTVSAFRNSTSLHIKSSDPAPTPKSLDATVTITAQALPQKPILQILGTSAMSQAPFDFFPTTPQQKLTTSGVLSKHLKTSAHVSKNTLPSPTVTTTNSPSLTSSRTLSSSATATFTHLNSSEKSLSSIRSEPLTTTRLIRTSRHLADFPRLFGIT